MKLFALLLSLAIPASAQELVQAIELPRATMRDLAAIPLREQSRVIEQRWLPRFEHAFAIDSFAENATITTNATAAPPATVFVADTSEKLSPPDASGAVGPQHVVSVHNSGVTVQSRTGAVITRATLSQFWFSNAPATTYYDPRVIYDAQYDRWVIMSIYDEKAVMIAISETADPTGAWRRYSITESKADFAQLVLAGDSIVAGTTHWTDIRSYFFVIPRATAYANPVTLTATRIDAGMSNATPVASETQKWIVVASDTTILWRPLDLSAPWRTVAAPQGFGVVYGGSLPQAGGPPLDAGFGVAESAIERGGRIYMVMDRLTLATSRHVIQWCALDPVAGQATFATIADPDPNVSYGYPSLAINNAGTMLMGFGVFSPSTYPSSGYLSRDLLGNWSAMGRMATGDSAFQWTDRWGDYSSTVVDPVDKTTFWTLQMYTHAGTWETAWARVGAAGPSKRRTARH